MLPQFVLEVDSVHDVPLSCGRQFIPDFERPEGALGAAFMKERALLQVHSATMLTSVCWQYDCDWRLAAVHVHLACCDMQRLSAA